MSAMDPNPVQESGNVRLLRRRGRPRVPLRHRMPKEKLRRGVYLIPSLFTAGNLMCGFFSIIATFRGDYVTAALLILLANVFDGIDGYAARLTKTTSQFGVEFDSLADVVSFGVAPAVLVYLWALVPWETWGWLAACTYVVCGALQIVPFQRSVVGGVEEPFCRSADPGGGANDHFDRDPILLFRWRRIAQPAFDFVAGYLRLGGIDGKQYSVLQLEK